LIYNYLHGHPFVGGGGYSPKVATNFMEAVQAVVAGVSEVGPDPGPWKQSELHVAASLLTATALSVALSKYSQSKGVQEWLNNRIAQIIDDYCGNGPHSPLPGVNKGAYGLAAGLTFLAGTMPENILSEAINQLGPHVVRQIDREIERTGGPHPSGGGEQGPGSSE
jgi:hypothetical protein